MENGELPSMIHSYDANTKDSPDDLSGHQLPRDVPFALCQTYHISRIPPLLTQMYPNFGAYV